MINLGAVNKSTSRNATDDCRCYLAQGSVPNSDVFGPPGSESGIISMDPDQAKKLIKTLIPAV
jgi:hypothetical protein